MSEMSIQDEGRNRGGVWQGRIFMVTFDLASACGRYCATWAKFLLVDGDCPSYMTLGSDFDRLEGAGPDQSYEEYEDRKRFSMEVGEIVAAAYEAVKPAVDPVVEQQHWRSVREMVSRGTEAAERQQA
jgi:hypothetical protein